MRHLLLKQRINLFCRSVLRFIDRSACRTMGCFFDCFRAKDHQSSSNVAYNSSRVNSRRSQASQNQLSDLFLSEEKVASSGPVKRANDLDSIHIDKGLKEEAQFLKSCGTIPETPIEIRKGYKNQDPHQYERDSRPVQFHSWISSDSMVKLRMNEKTDEPPTTHKACEELGQHIVTSEQTPSSCVTNARSSGRIYSGSGDAVEEREGNIGSSSRGEVDKDSKATPAVGNVSERIRSVRFECDFDQSEDSSGSSYIGTSGNPKMTGKTNFAATSPNPTPLKLSEEMQTPGTIYPANLESEGRGKPRIRSQFVYSVSNPTETTSLSKVPEESDRSIEQAKVDVSNNQIEVGTPKTESRGKKEKESLDEKVSKDEPSLSPWLKHGNEVSPVSTTTPRAAITPGDRPILGMVAAHWKEGDLPQISPKWWDGNGIPNSTNKYKEDQKVSWHATPFEERLEKALSEESFISQRKPYIRNAGVKEEMEEDTAISQLQHSAQSKSVVSF